MRRKSAGHSVALGQEHLNMSPPYAARLDKMLTFGKVLP